MQERRCTAGLLHKTDYFDWPRSPGFYAAYDHGKWQAYVKASEYLREHGRPGVDVVLGFVLVPAAG